MVKSVNTNKVEMDKKVAIAVVFENPEFGKIRTLTDENGEPLFCAKDVCDILGYKIARCAVHQLVNTLDVVKHNAWVVTGKKKDGSEASYSDALCQRERFLCFGARLQAFYCREVQELGYG